MICDERSENEKQQKRSRASKVLPWHSQEGYDSKTDAKYLSEININIQGLSSTCGMAVKVAQRLIRSIKLHTPG